MKLFLTSIGQRFFCCLDSLSFRLNCGCPDFTTKLRIGSPRGLGIRRGSSLVLMAVAAGLSAVFNHDIICFVFAPIIGAALLQRRLNAIPFLIALAIASNMGAAATIIGNPQDMMIAQVAHLDFGRYLLWCAVPVLVALAFAYAIIWQMSRRHLQSVLTVRDLNLKKRSSRTIASTRSRV